MRVRKAYWVSPIRNCLSKFVVAFFFFRIKPFDVLSKGKTTKSSLFVADRQA